MRDSRDSMSRMGRRSAVSSVGAENPNADGRGEFAALAGKFAISAAQEVKKAAQLTDEDKANVQATQGANIRVQEDQIREQSTGVDKFIGKQKNRMKYANSLASRNAADGVLNSQAQTLEKNEHLEPKDFNKQATEDANARFADMYDGDVASIEAAQKEFQRSLPKLANKHAAVHANYLQGKVWDESVSQYSEEMTDISTTLNGKGAPVDLAAAEERAETFFGDDYSIGEDGDYSPEATIRQKGEALRQQVAAGNSYFYAQAKDTGWLDEVAKTNPELSAAVERAKGLAVKRSSEALDVEVTTAINNAITAGKPDELQAALERVEGFAERGFDTPTEQLLEQNYRKRLILAHSSSQLKLSAAQIQTQNAAALLDGSHIPAIVAQHNKATKDEALDMFTIQQVQSGINDAGGQVDGLDPAAALDMAMLNPTIMSNVFAKGKELGAMSPKLKDAMNVYFNNPQQFYDDEGLGLTQNGTRRLSAFAAAESVDPASFTEFLGNDGMARYQIIKNGAGSDLGKVSAQLAAYENRKGNPAGMTVIDPDSKLSKQAWVRQQMRIDENASPAVVEYYTQLFDTGFAVSGTVEGGTAWAERYAMQVDKQLAGTPVRNGKLYETATGHSLDTMKTTLEGTVDSTGNTILTDLVSMHTSELSNVRTLSDLDGLEMTADPVSGDVFITSSALQSPIIIDGSDMAATMKMYDDQVARQTSNQAIIDRRNVHTSVFYNKQVKQAPYSYGTQDPNAPSTTVQEAAEPIQVPTNVPAWLEDKGWEDYLADTGREGQQTLRELGISPTIETVPQPEIVAPIEDTESEIVPPEGVEASQFGRDQRPPAEIARRVDVAMKAYNITPAMQGALLQSSPEALQIIRHEGYKDHVYFDSAKPPIPTWGFGFALSKAQMATGKWTPFVTKPSKESALKQLEAELLTAKGIAGRYLSVATINDPSPEMLNIMTNMAYNHGEAGLGEYAGVSEGLRTGNATKVLREMEDSKWYRSYEKASKNPEGMDRASELIHRMEAELIKQGDWTWE